MTEEEAFKKARRDLLETTFVDRQRHDSITVGASFSSAPPPPPPPPSVMPLFEKAPDSGV